MTDLFVLFIIRMCSVFLVAVVTKLIWHYIAIMATRRELLKLDFWFYENMLHLG